MKNNNFKVTAIICAAGKGERAGFSKNKLLVPLYGAPALYHTLEKFNNPYVDEVVVTASERDFKEIENLCKPFGYKVVSGGASRTQSVRLALKEVTGDIVLIHDGARPFLSRQLILDCIQGVEQFSSAVCALPFTDTAVSVQDGFICGNIERSTLYALQTPQAFYTKDIRRAYLLAGEKNYTDDSQIYGEFIGKPHIVRGELQNIKLTYRQDFFKDLPPAPLSDGDVRTGLGVDVHAFGEGCGVVLGGVKIPCDGGLIAHSDGDVLIHAVMDALLSAAGLKDIGHYFPDADDSLKGADSALMLARTVEIIAEKGYKVANLSVTVQAERPRLSGYIDKIKERLSRITGAPVENIAVAAGTCEGLGFVGKGLGITAYCSASIKKS